MRRQHPITQYHPNTINNHYAQSSWAQAYPGAPPRRSVPLPTSRLSPLVDNEQPLPDVPFAKKLAVPLIWGEWRYLPRPRSMQPRREIIDDVLREPATSPPLGELQMIINIDGQGDREDRIRPRVNGATFVSVSDVIEAAKAAQRETRQVLASGRLPNNGESFGKSRDGMMVWRGLIAREDEKGNLVLFLKV